MKLAFKIDLIVSTRRGFKIKWHPCYQVELRFELILAAVGAHESL